MTPEQDIGRVIASVCEDSGHWPYTRDAELYIGFRPAGDGFSFAGDRIIRAKVSYDVVICARRGAMAEKMEEMRYKLYDALLRGGWKFEGEPGPETYSDAHGLFMWPVTVSKGCVLGAGGLPAVIGR